MFFLCLMVREIPPEGNSVTLLKSNLGAGGCPLKAIVTLSTDCVESPHKHLIYLLNANHLNTALTCEIRMTA